MAEKITTMVLKVDLDCTKCSRKVKSLLCKYPQIRDQIYDEKANTVTITVVCCSPEKIRDKLCYKGRGTIKSIDIKEKPKPTPAPAGDKPKPKPAAAESKPAGDKPKPTPSAAESKPAADKPKDKPQQVVVVEPPSQPAAPSKPPAKAPETGPAAPAPVVAAGYLAPYPTYGVCYVPCHEGPYYGTPGPPYYGMPAPPCNCGRSVGYDGYGRGYPECRGDCFSDENPSAACTVM